MRHFLTILWLAVMPAAATAQLFPDHDSTFVNDFAGVLDDEAEARVTAQLEQLREETDIEMTVVTLSRLAPYAPDMTLETYATALFNHWGVGDATRNDGIMVLVATEDREMQLELGEAIATGWDPTAQFVVDQSFLPGFRAGDYAAGIETGVAATIAEIAKPWFEKRPPRDPGASTLTSATAEGDAPRRDADGGGSLAWLLYVVGGAIAAFLGVRTLRKRMRRCPECQTRGSLSVSRDVVTAATTRTAGEAREVTRCSNCGYTATALIPLAMLSDNSKSDSSGGSFGGGKSSGGGASGKW